MRNFISLYTPLNAPRLILSLTLFFVGLSFIWPAPVMPSGLPNIPTEQTYVPTLNTSISAKLNSTNNISGTSSLPRRIVIPKLGIDLPVTNSLVENGYWQVSNTTVSYGVGSGEINQPGNAVFFAHDRADQFLPLKSATIGTIIYVYTDSSWYPYQVFQKKKVSPADISVLAPSNKKIITLYTCDGINDSERLIVQAAAAGI